jgi:hypothetical protein
VTAQYREIYLKDNNFGLVKQCIKAHQKKDIKRLTKIFLTKSLVDIAQQTRGFNAAASEAAILDMVIHAFHTPAFDCSLIARFCFRSIGMKFTLRSTSAAGLWRSVRRLNTLTV